MLIIQVVVKPIQLMDTGESSSSMVQPETQFIEPSPQLPDLGIIPQSSDTAGPQQQINLFHEILDIIDENPCDHPVLPSNFD